MFFQEKRENNLMCCSADSSEIWRRCNSCKKPINFGAKYWVCSVSTCNRKRTGLIFCDVSCWDAHVPLMNHRESWAEERKAPTRGEWAKILSGTAPSPRKEKTESEPKVTSDPASKLSSELSVEPSGKISAARAPKVILRRSRSE